MSLVLASQLLYRSYQPSLPTSLSYIVALTRRCSRQTPVADMGTYTGRHINSLQVFHGASKTHRTVDKVNCFATRDRTSLDEPIPYGQTSC